MLITGNHSCRSRGKVNCRSIVPFWNEQSNSDLYVGAFAGSAFGTVVINNGTKLTRGLFSSVLDMGYMFGEHFGLELDQLHINPVEEDSDSSAAPSGTGQARGRRTT